jgi:hypothetical protein
LSLSLCTPSAASARRWYFLQMRDKNRFIF